MESGLEARSPGPLSLKFFLSSQNIAFVKSEVKSMCTCFNHWQSQFKEQTWYWLPCLFLQCLLSFNQVPGPQALSWLPRIGPLQFVLWAYLTYPFSTILVSFPLPFSVPGYSEQGAIPTNITLLGGRPTALTHPLPALVVFNPHCTNTSPTTWHRTSSPTIMDRDQLIGPSPVLLPFTII